MKFRHGFVSNSSSSSFLIGFDRKPKTAKELREILFGDMEYLQYSDRSFKTTKIADTIFNDLKNQRAVGVFLMEKELDGNFPGCPEHWREDRPSDKLERQFSGSFPQYQGQWRKPTEIKETMAQQLVEKIRVASNKEREEDEAEMKKELGKYMKKEVLPMMNDKKVYVVEYGDHDHEAIEHGDVFCNIPHIRISHH